MLLLIVLVILGYEIAMRLKAPSARERERRQRSERDQVVWALGALDVFCEATSKNKPYTIQHQRFQALRSRLQKAEGVEAIEPIVKEVRQAVQDAHRWSCFSQHEDVIVELERQFQRVSPE